MSEKYDLVIRSGTIVDGSGTQPFLGDVAVSNGKIVAIGNVDGNGNQEIDATDKLITPGFVDIHTHYDGQATWDSHLSPSSYQGVTTAVMGNCGVGFAPVRPQDHNRLIELMEGVEDIPGTALHEGLQWNWESFPEYLDALEARSYDMDICAQLPHGALRVFVMGERGANLEAATEDDIAQMRAITKEAMDAGAIGFSTSRTLNHKTVKGDPTPSLRATEAELTGIALGVKDAGNGVLELISDFNMPDLETEFSMIRRILDTSNRPMSISLGQSHRAPDGWRDLLGLIGDAANDGLNVKAQVAPRPIGVLLGIQGSANPFIQSKVFQRLIGKPIEEVVSTMKTQAFRDELLSDVTAEGAPGPLFPYERVFALGDSPDYEPAKESSIAAIAAREGKIPEEVAYDLLLENDGRSFLLAPFANYANFNLDACGEMMASPHTLMGLGDGGAHVGLISDGSFTTYLLSHWGRDREQGRMDIAELVKMQCADNADFIGLHDRGKIEVGLKGDLNVIDFNELRVETPEMVFDLPAGGKRLVQRASGYEATIVSGKIVTRNGVHTGELPGRLVRSPHSAMARA